MSREAQSSVGGGVFALTIASHTYPQQGVMVWGVISFDSRNHLAVISGTVRAQLDDNDIVQPVMLPLLLRLFGITFQDNNARPHMARVAILGSIC